MHVNHLKLFKSSKGEHIKHKLSGGRRRWGFTQMTVYKVWTLESCCFSPTGPWVDYAMLASLIYKLAFLNAIATLSLSPFASKSIHSRCYKKNVILTYQKPILLFYHIILQYLYRVPIFGLGTKSEWDLDPADPVQWICREWVKELGFNEFDNG